MNNKIEKRDQNLKEYNMIALTCKAKNVQYLNKKKKK